VDFDVNVLRKKINEVQKEIAAKKKVCFLRDVVLDRCVHFILQAKQPADDLVATKKEIDAQVEEKKKEAKEFEIRMRQKASTVGNIVGKNAPVSQTEVNSLSFLDVINPSMTK
jgi:seryl-tRNA synthetase